MFEHPSKMFLNLSHIFYFLFERDVKSQLTTGPSLAQGGMSVVQSVSCSNGCYVETADYLAHYEVTGDSPNVRRMYLHCFEFSFCFRVIKSKCAI